MSRLDKLKRLKDEVNRLFHEGLDEISVIDQLRADEQFADISYEQVRAFYSSLQEEFNAEAEDKHLIAQCEQLIETYQQVLGRLQQILRQLQILLTENQQISGDLRQNVGQLIPKYEQNIAVLERNLAMQQQMKAGLEFVIKYRQNSNKFLINEEYPVDRLVARNFLQGRFFMASENSDATDDIYTVKFQDLFQGTAKSFTISKHSRLLRIYNLTFPFVLFHEFDTSNRVTHFRLVKLDFGSESLEVVQSLQYNVFCQVLVSASNTSKFLLQRDDVVNECKLVRNQIQIGKKLALGPSFNISRSSYFDEQVCSLQFGRPLDNQVRSFPLTQVKMLTYDLERDENSTQDIDSTPGNFDCFFPDYPNYSAWIRNTVFVTVEFPLVLKCGVIFTNPQLRNWKFVEFATDLLVARIQSFTDATLMICSENGQDKRKIYKLQMRKPDFLRNMAWATMIKLLKEAKIEDSYKEARHYLPLNSEIQPFIFFKD